LANPPQSGAINEAVRIGQVVACAVGWMACSFARPPDLAGPEDAQVADAPDAAGSDGAAGDAVPPPQFLSCAQIPTNCSSNGSDNCCNSPEIPGGTYARGYDVAGDRNSNDGSFPATISSFRLDKYRVTVPASSLSIDRSRASYYDDARLVCDVLCQSV